MTAKEIAVAIGVKTGRVTRLVREGRLRQWNVLGKKLISLRDIRAIILEDNATADAKGWRGRYVDAALRAAFLRAFPEAESKTDGHECSLTVSVRPPRSVSQWVPYNPDNPHPPHVTIIHVKEAWPRQAAELTTALRGAALAIAPVPLVCGEVGYFDHEAQRIAWSGVVGAGLGALHQLAVQASEVVGLEAVTHEGGYHPHMTLAQLAVGEDYTGAAPPVGTTWDADAIVIEYDGTCTIIPLTGNTRTVGEVAPA